MIIVKKEERNSKKTAIETKEIRGIREWEKKTEIW